MANPVKLATDDLKKEHQLILRMLEVLKAASVRLERGEDIDLQVFDEAVDFIKMFADKCHHEKEQDTLFPLMVKRGFSKESGPIAVMLMEHDQGRQFVRDLAMAVMQLRKGESDAKAAIIRSSLGYANLLQHHIYKEDNILYPMGDQVLTAEDNNQLLERFAQIEEQVVGAGKHEEYHAMVGRLEKYLGIDAGESGNR